MSIVFDIATSAEFWRKEYPLNRAPASPQICAPSDCASSKAELLDLAPRWALNLLRDGAEKLCLLVFDNSVRERSSVHQTYSWSGPIPEGSFYELKPSVFIESPAFMFLHAASILSFEQLIAFGDELCGLYSFSEQEKRGFRQREVPLITTEQLRRYLDGAAGCTGRKAAIRALPFVVDRSASPMETFDEMTMCLPYRLGGYGMPEFQMNAEVPLTPRAARIARRSSCRLDMGNIDALLDVEHDGKLDHSTDEDKDSDRDRVNGLKEMGFEVIELTRHEVGDLFVYETIIERIAKILGKRIHASKKGATPERLRLRKEIADWNRSSGKIR